MTVPALFSIPFYLAAAILIVGGVLILFGVKQRPGETGGDLVGQWLGIWLVAALLVLIGASLQHL